VGQILTSGQKQFEYYDTLRQSITIRAQLRALLDSAQRLQLAQYQSSFSEPPGRFQDFDTARCQLSKQIGTLAPADDIAPQDIQRLKQLISEFLRDVT